MRALFPLLLLAVLGCRETLRPAVEAPDVNPTGAYQALLQRAVTIRGYVDYDKLEAHRKPLDDYVAWLSSRKAWRGARPTERPADYVNAYNALVLYQVLERDRPESVLDVPGWIPVAGSGFFVETAFDLGQEILSLQELEHERVRMSEMDYRVHAVLNCASRSCPPLRRELYSHRGFAAQMRDQFTEWMADDRGVRFEDDQILFSPIFEWFERDFRFFSGGENPCEIAAKHSSGQRYARLKKAAAAGCPFTTFEYDWRLNDAVAIRAGK